MFGRSKDALYEARIEDLKKEHQRTVEALTAWIEQLTAQVGGQMAQTVQVSAPDNVVPMTMHTSDDEQVLRDLHSNGEINDSQLSEALEQLKFLSGDVVVAT
jgi:hypothetical protein